MKKGFRILKFKKARPIFEVKDIPKTKSGKIVRRAMRDIVRNLHVDITYDYSTLANQEDFLCSDM